MGTSTEVIDISSDSEDDIIEISNKENGNEKKDEAVNTSLESRNNVVSAHASEVLQPGNADTQNNTSLNVYKGSLKKLMDVIAPLVKPSEKEKISTRINKKIRLITTSGNAALAEDFQNTLKVNIEKVATNISANPDRKWPELESLMNVMTFDNITKIMGSSRHEPPNPLSESEARFRKNVIKLEKKLKTLENKIHDWDQKEVDLDDETNSAYLVKARMIQHYMKYWNMLCDLHKCDKSNTGRSIQKKISPEDVTKFPEINEAVFKYLNTRVKESSYYFPDYHDILKVVKEEANARSILINDSEIHILAKEFFSHIANILRKRRIKDFRLTVSIPEDDDPANTDEDLLRKLEENRLKGKKEEDIIREFAEKQGEMKLEAIEVIDEDPDLSPPGSDSEQDIDEDEDSVSNCDTLSVTDDDKTDFEVNGVSQNGVVREEESDASTETDSETENHKKPRLELA